MAIDRETENDGASTRKTKKKTHLHTHLTRTKQTPTPTPAPVVVTVQQNISSLSVNAQTMQIAGSGFDASSPAANTVAFDLGAVGVVTAATPTLLTVFLSSRASSLGPLSAVVTSSGVSSGSPVPVATVTATRALIRSFGNGEVTACEFVAGSLVNCAVPPAWQSFSGGTPTSIAVVGSIAYIVDYDGSFVAEAALDSSGSITSVTIPAASTGVHPWGIAIQNSVA